MNINLISKYYSRKWPISTHLSINLEGAGSLVQLDPSDALHLAGLLYVGPVGSDRQPHEILTNRELLHVARANFRALKETNSLKFAQKTESQKAHCLVFSSAVFLWLKVLG